MCKDILESNQQYWVADGREELKKSIFWPEYPHMREGEHEAWSTV